MTSPQEQYLDAMNSAADTWAKAAQQFFTAPQAANFPSVNVDASEVIDQVFDFAEQFLSAQRQFAKSLASAGNNVAEQMRSQAETFQSTVQEATEQSLAAGQEFADKSAELNKDATAKASAAAEKVADETVAATKANVEAASEAVSSAADKGAEGTEKAAAAPRRRPAAKKA